MPDYLSAFQPVGPVPGVPTPDSQGAVNSFNAAVQGAGQKALQYTAHKENLAETQRQSIQDAINRQQLQQSENMNRLQVQSRQQTHEKDMQTEQLKALKEADEKGRESTQAHDRNMESARERVKTARERVGSIGNSFNTTYLRAMSRATALDSTSKFIGQGLVLEQFLQNSPINKLLATQNKAQVAPVAKSEGGTPGQPSKSWTKALSTMKQDGIDWKEQKNFNPYQGASVLNMVEDPQGEAMIRSKGLRGITDYLDARGNKVGAQWFAAMLEDFDGENDPSPETMKKAIPEAMASNAADFLHQVDQELLAILGNENLDPETAKSVRGALGTVNNTLDKYYRTMGTVTEASAIGAEATQSGIVDSLVDLVGGKDYVKRNREQATALSDWLQSAPMEEVGRLNERYRIKADSIIQREYEARLKGDTATAEKYASQLEELLAKYSSEAGALVPPPPLGIKPPAPVATTQPVARPEDF